MDMFCKALDLLVQGAKAKDIIEILSDGLVSDCRAEQEIENFLFV